MVKVKGSDALKIWLYFTGGGYREREFMDILKKYRISFKEAKKIAEKFDREVFGKDGLIRGGSDETKG